MKRTLNIAGTSALFIAALASCGRKDPGEPDARKPTASRTTPASARISGRMPDHESTPHATVACRSGEALVFACRIAASGKPVTLCTATGAPSVTTYRFGDPASPELTFTDAGKSPASAFHRTPLTFAGATGGYAYSFRNGDVTYALYSISGNEGLARSGVAVVDASGRRTADLECDPASVQETESVALIRRTREWPTDVATANVIR